MAAASTIRFASRAQTRAGVRRVSAEFINHVMNKAESANAIVGRAATGGRAFRTPPLWPRKRPWVVPRSSSTPPHALLELVQPPTLPGLTLTARAYRKPYPAPRAWAERIGYCLA